MQPKEKRNWLEQSKNCKQLKIKFEKKTKSSVFFFSFYCNFRHYRAFSRHLNKKKQTKNKKKQQREEHINQICKQNMKPPSESLTCYPCQ